MSDNYAASMLEEIHDQNKAILEMVSGTQTIVARLPVIEQKVDSLERNMKVIKLAA